jgi:hypothetical protein
MSVTYEVSKERESLIISIEAVSLNALYDEEFESNKRFHQEQIVVSDSAESILTSIERTVKKKSQKRVEKKFESQSLVDMFDDALSVYEKSISVRQILKVNKIDINLLN